MQCQIQSVAIELIDTCWNVNDPVSQAVQMYNGGINRYMLECKQGERVCRKLILRELIDTCWNVNKEEYKINIEEFMN